MSATGVPYRLESEVAADVLFALLDARLLHPDTLNQALPLAGLTFADLADAKMRHDEYRRSLRVVSRGTSVPYSILFDSPPVEAFIDAACEHFSVGPARLTSPSRDTELTRVRHVAMAAARMAGGHSYPEIGRAFNRDHTSVVSACQRVEADARMRSAAEALCADVKGEIPEISRSVQQAPVAMLASHDRKGRRNGTN